MGALSGAGKPPSSPTEEGWWGQGEKKNKKERVYSKSRTAKGYWVNLPSLRGGRTDKEEPRERGEKPRGHRGFQLQWDTPVRKNTSKGQSYKCISSYSNKEGQSEEEKRGMGLNR